VYDVLLLMLGIINNAKDFSTRESGVSSNIAMIVGVLILIAAIVAGIAFVKK
jgi:hypothetical protein